MAIGLGIGGSRWGSKGFRVPASEVGIWFNLKSPLKASLETGQSGPKKMFVD